MNPRGHEVSPDGMGQAGCWLEGPNPTGNLKLGQSPPFHTCKCQEPERANDQGHSTSLGPRWDQKSGPTPSHSQAPGQPSPPQWVKMSLTQGPGVLGPLIGQRLEAKGRPVGRSVETTTGPPYPGVVLCLAGNRSDWGSETQIESQLCHPPCDVQQAPLRR